MNINNMLKQIICIVAIFGISSTSYAATYTVINANDTGTGSLRWAITQANNNNNTFDVIDLISRVLVSRLFVLYHSCHHFSIHQEYLSTA